MDIANRLVHLVRESRRVLLTGPEGPDGDSIGACLALQSALRRLAPGTTVEVAGDPGFRYAWMPGANGMIHDADVGAYDGVVVLDGDRSRLTPRVHLAFTSARWTGLVDHHRSTDASGYSWALFDAHSESTCVMIRGLYTAWDIPLDRDSAAQMYTGLIFDTGGFRYSNTRASSHRLAAELLETGLDHAQVMMRVLMERRPPGLRLLGRMLDQARFWAGGRVAVAVYAKDLGRELGAEESDAEGVVDALLHTHGVELAVVVVERGPSKVKLSLRSRGGVDVAALARSLSDGGGGHAKAAGVVIAEPLGVAMERLEPILSDAVG